MFSTYEKTKDAQSEPKPTILSLIDDEIDIIIITISFR